ncbi:hypothetical protein [Sneathiella glossodoripedis]|uniref:hypothetical protein n=1 Tax=Sneathiella glossodoripedis TaxID=418853 RepID=UPI0011DDD301|nr:hypothetical protein [Sneathiella glossodoripedis]
MKLIRLLAWGPLMLTPLSTASAGSIQSELSVFNAEDCKPVLRIIWIGTTLTGNRYKGSNILPVTSLPVNLVKRKSMRAGLGLKAAPVILSSRWTVPAISKQTTQRASAAKKDYPKIRSASRARRF